MWSTKVALQKGLLVGEIFHRSVYIPEAGNSTDALVVEELVIVACPGAPDNTVQYPISVFELNALCVKLTELPHTSMGPETVAIVVGIPTFKVTC